MSQRSKIAGVTTDENDFWTEVTCNNGKKVFAISYTQDQGAEARYRHILSRIRAYASDRKIAANYSNLDDVIWKTHAINGLKMQRLQMETIRDEVAVALRAADAQATRLRSSHQKHLDCIAYIDMQLQLS